MKIPSLVTLQVMESDVLRGQSGDCARCPVALAFHRIFPGAQKIHVWIGWQGSAFASIWTNDGVAKYQLPPVAQRFIGGFDFDGHGKPFTAVAKLAYAGAAQ